MKLLQSNSVVTSLVYLAIFLVPVIGLSQAPQTVSYTGILTDDMDVLQANATVNLTFTLYDMPTGGTNQWTETHSGVTTTALGEFAVVLGSITPFFSDQFKNAAWLGIQVDANPEITPRVEMTSVPTAMGLAMPFVASANSGSAAIDLNNTGGGPAANFSMSDPVSSAPAVNVFAQGNGDGVLVNHSGTNGVAGQFLSSNASNPWPALAGASAGSGPAVQGNVDAGGTGPAGQFNINEVTNAQPAINATTSGTGEGLTTNSSIVIGDNVTNDMAGEIRFNGAFEGFDGGSWQPFGGGLNLPFGASQADGGDLFFLANSGTGQAASFNINNPGSGAPAMNAFTDGLGSAGTFNINNAANGFPAISGSTDGTGFAISADNSGLGPALNVGIGNVANASAAVDIINSGTGYGIHLQQNNAGATFPALQINNDGASGIFVFQQGTNGSAGDFLITDGSNPGTAVNANTVGTGRAGSFTISNGGNSDVALAASTDGTGNVILSEHSGSTGDAGFFDVLGGGSGRAVFARTNGTGTAVYSEHNGAAGLAGQFEITNVANASNAVQVSTAGTGRAGDFSINNATNGDVALAASTNGTGKAGSFIISNASNSDAALEANTNGPGNAILSENSGPSGNAGFFDILGGGSGSAIAARTNGTGNAGNFQITNGSSTSSALFVGTSGTGFALEATTGGTSGHAAYFDASNAANTDPSLNALNTGGGSAGYFEVINTLNASIALESRTNGTGAALSVDRNNAAAGNVAIFQDQGTNIARITDTGLGIFEAGTQMGGADLAEAFEVEGLKENYEPGDVMVISTQSDRKLEKSLIAYDTKVVGVYATKPGVLLTEYGVDDDISHTIPLGVVGVIPTKVCSEGGEIKRGDLLVTSSTPGHAMKATGIEMQGMTFYPNGTIIGKALQDFKGDQGVIKVMVNVK